MQTSTEDDESLDHVTLSQSQPIDKNRRESSDNARLSDDIVNVYKHHLLYIGKVDLPCHPVRMRYLPHSTQRYLLYGKNGYQEITACQSPQFYTLEEISWETLACDCVQTSNQFLYVVARCPLSAVLACYDQFMSAQNIVEIRYPLGCLSSLATNLSCTHIYGTNQELNCVLRFSVKDLDLTKAERFGALWRPFDCCTSQGFGGQSGGEQQVQFLFVSNLDAGICVFDMNTMEIVAECGDDLSPGAKYLAYDPKRSLLFVSSSCDRLLRCYKFNFQPPQPPAQLPSTPPPVPAPAAAPTLVKRGDFLVAKRQALGAVSCGPQCVMWDPETGNLAVIGWSHARGKFCIRVFHVNV